MPRPGSEPRRTPPQARSPRPPAADPAAGARTGGRRSPGTANPEVGTSAGVVPGTAGRGAEPEPGRLFLGAAYVLGVVLGLGLGLYGVFLLPAGPGLGGTVIAVGLLLALFGNAAAALLVRWLTGTRLGPMTVLIGWVPVVLLFSAARPEGDLLLRANAAGYTFLLVGGLSPVVVTAVGRARRGLTALPPPR
ncbi:DUF6113 family protein [Frankia sp. AgB32]|uniref:DUF6113 family protein n=1 Tax=Frankia sp. AgB32 TaxID=631119 RepID=UPI00200FA7BB|nr:DUF6113 family protein [Frankia sp. AgB32]MCK9893699.1 DUF6113 family protein [Frankia sp. AgB32]